MNLIDISDCYFAFFKWFNHLKLLKIQILGYVIMPNHFHGILFIPDEFPKSLNYVVSNGKRFIAYKIIKQLKLS